MSTQIQRLNQTSIKVNDKITNMDVNGTYKPLTEQLTSAEEKSLTEFVNSEKLNLNNRKN